MNLACEVPHIGSNSSYRLQVEVTQSLFGRRSNASADSCKRPRLRMVRGSAWTFSRLRLSNHALTYDKCTRRVDLFLNQTNPNQLPHHLSVLARSVAHPSSSSRPG